MFTKTIILSFVFLSVNLLAQFKSADQYIEPIVGFSFLGSTVHYGINYEHTFILEGNHKVGFGLTTRYWKYSETLDNINTNFVIFLVGVQANYHFNLKNKKVNPWVGITLAYNLGSTKASWNIEPHPEGVLESPDQVGIWKSVHAGLRYWLTENIAASTKIGLGNMSYGALDLGVVFRM